MKQNLITDVIQGMLPYLNNAQSKRLQEVLQFTLVNYEVIENTGKEKEFEKDFVELFLSAKRIEGGRRNHLNIISQRLFQCLPLLARRLSILLPKIIENILQIIIKQKH